MEKLFKSMEDMSSSSEVKSWLSSAEEIGSNQDILTEILVRVPAKPLLKFKCVSKQWLSLISDPKFCICHSRCQRVLNNTPSALLLSNWYTSTSEFQVLPLKDSTKVPFLDHLNIPRIKIQQSCNGLLLCESTKLFKPGKQKWELVETEAGMELIPVPLGPWEDYCSSVVDDDDFGHRYFICNPTMKQVKRLVFPSYIYEGSDLFGAWLNLAFDPLKSPYYKVISMRLLNFYAREYEIYIYSSETELWNETRITFQAPSGMITRAGVFLNGAIHWPCRSQTSLYFDVDSETLKTMPMPTIPVSDGVRMWWILYFGESRGHLHIVVRDYDSFLPLEKFDVLEMAADYSGWFVRYHVDLYSVRTLLMELALHPKEDPMSHNGNLYYSRTRLMKITLLYSEDLGQFSVLGIIRADKEEESMIVLYLECGRAIFYNPCNGTLNKFYDLESRPTPGSIVNELDYHANDAYQYFHTLFPICE